jgi:hypothetical protein
MQDTIKRILEKYPTARASTQFAGKHEIYSLFEKLKEEVSSLDFVNGNQNLLVKVSYGKGRWAAIPWLAILDSRVTISTQRGVFVVILFQSKGEGIYLKLAQGVTEIVKDSATGLIAIEELKKRANTIKVMNPTMPGSTLDAVFNDQVTQQEVGKVVSLGELYEASTIYSKHYQRDSIPGGADFARDLSALVSCYENIFRK